MKLREMPNTVVHCKTREEYDRLMQIYEEAGWSWSIGQIRPHEGFEEWSEGGKYQLYITVKNIWDRRSSYEFAKTLSLSDFLREQGIDQLKPEDLSPGDWVEVVEDFSYGGCRHKYKKGEKYQVKECGIELWLKHPNGSSCWITEGNEAKLRKCSPPEDKKPFWKRSVTAGESFPVAQPDLIQWTLADYNFYTSSQPSPMSLVDAYRNSGLNPEERVLRKAGVKDSCGKLTCDGEKLLLAMLADKFKTDLAKEAKRFLKLKKSDEDDE